MRTLDSAGPIGKPCEGPDPVRISLENLFCAGAQKHGRVRPNSPDKALLCLKIWDAVHAHHKEKTHGLGHHAPRRSIYDKRRRKRSSKRNWKERRSLHSALWQCERHTTLKQLLGRICVAPFFLRRALGNTFVFGQSAKRVVVAS